METKLPNTLLGIEIPDSALASRKLFIQLGVVVTISVTVWLWIPILFGEKVASALYVLDVGQGDSQLVLLASPDERSQIKVLIDGGKDRAVLNELNEVLGSRSDKYIDIVILTHPDLDHFGGLIEVLQRYDVGIFISNGRKGTSEAFTDLENVLRERNIQSVVLREGDAIRYAGHVFSILSPDTTLSKTAAINEASIVAMLSSEDVRVLLTGDIGFPAENALLKKKHPLNADILKVGHHGSKNSSSENFVAAVQPTIAVIGVGKNSYGHPTPRVLETLELAGARTYRTDTDGTIEIPLDRNTVAEGKKQNEGFLASVASIVTGSYRQENFTKVSLAHADEESTPSQLVLYKTCVFRMGGMPRHAPVIFSEIAWMGRTDAATHEWIELRNVSGKALNLSGWQILNENERIHFTFPQKTVLENSQIVLARNAVKETVDAQFVFTGSLRNSNEGLRLFDNECNVIDEIPLSSSWSAGNNKTKQTMERAVDLSWRTSADPGGTPGR